MAKPRRLAAQAGEWIDRETRIRFRFEGRDYEGYAGDTVSSALLANGISLLGRSFKYHRPRGVYSFANHDINNMMASDSETHIRADVTPIVDGLSLKPTNLFGSLKKDKGALLQWLAPMLPVGFYYKTFYKPKRLFPMWERLIRRLAGIGEIDSLWPRQIRAKQTAYCDVLVIGAGPSGIAAALAASNQDAKVMLVDENARPGGSLIYQAADQQPILTELQTAIEKGNIEFYPSSVIAGAYADRWLALVTPQQLIRIRAKAVIVATGVYEQPAVFRNNDLPGVMLASAAQRLLHRHAVAVCEEAVILAANDQAYQVAADLIMAGITIKAIVDLRPAPQLPETARTLADRNIPIHSKHCIYEAHERDQQLYKVSIAPLGQDNQPQAEKCFALECDGLLMSVGWAPAAPLLYQAGAQLKFNEQLQQLVPHTLPAGYYATGRLAGVYDLEARIEHGRACGLAAAQKKQAPTVEIEANAQSHPYPIFKHPKGKNFVDLDEDLQLNDLLNATTEGFDNIELLKRYSTVGMGPSQGKHANMNNIRILARRLGQGIDATGSTTARPFFHPVAMGKLAGLRLRPQRQTAMHALHQQAGAVWMEAGHWLRPKYYGTAPMQEAIRDEVMAVHEHAGLIDVSSLGKISIIGKDAVELLQRFYTMSYSKMAVGTTRYALMVDEGGIVIDDGIIARLDDEVFYVTTTSSGAPAVYREMQKRAIEWGLDVDLVNLTSQMAAMNLAGPDSAKVLARLSNLDLSQEGFPFLRLQQATIAGIDCLLMRVGFVGEAGYEIHVPAHFAASLWQALMDAGKDCNIRPFGVEAQRLLRLQKGHIIVGQDTDGTSSPYDANMDWAIRKEKPFFIGKRSLAILEDKHLYKLVGFRLETNQQSLSLEECNLIIHAGEIAGRVTSIGHSPKLGKTIGLAMIKKELADKMQTLAIRLSDGQMISADVCSTPFYDPDNSRQKTEAEWSVTEIVKHEPPGSSSAVIRNNDDNGLVVLSTFQLFQIKGPDSHNFIQQLGLDGPDDLFTTVHLHQGGFISRTGSREYLLFCGHNTTLAQQLSNSVGYKTGLSIYPRSDLHLELQQSQFEKLFKELCALEDVSDSAQITYTQFANISCWIQAQIVDDTYHYHIGCDPSYGPYLYRTLSHLLHEANAIEDLSTS